MGAKGFDMFAIEKLPQVKLSQIEEVGNDYRNGMAATYLYRPFVSEVHTYLLTYDARK